MKAYIFRAACLTLLVGAALSSVATKSSELKTEADFTATIPKGGLERSVEKVFNLGPSSTLQVIDETGSAVYLPEKNEGSDEAVADRFSVAYQYENGVCGFTKTIKFNEVFPGYTAPLWVVEELTSAESEKGSVKYTFTNPPADYSSGGMSFCVRFKTLRPAASNTGTSTSTAPTPSTPDKVQEEDSTKPQGQDGPPVAPNPHPAPPSSEGSVPSVQDNADQEDDADRVEDEEDGENHGSPPRGPSGDHSGAGSPVTPPRTDAPGLSQNLQGGFGASEERTPGSEPGNDGHEPASDSIQEHNGAQIRRLTESPAETEAFLTIVVHSAAWCLTNGVSALSLAILTVATALLAVS
ncbi:UNVERIFIED_CONTAM: Toxoplasma gondii family A protein [Hammondia hammondi]|eukprot:XP_008887110.1 Toxoplasma gondii family A protein [Hammondia hammondi]